jgi:hypothetical protein
MRAADNATKCREVDLGAFLRAQPHYVFLDGNLFPDHESLHRCLAATEIQKLPHFQ